MDRRAVLRILAVGVASAPGCLGGSDGPDTTTDDATSTADATSTGSTPTSTSRTTQTETTTDGTRTDGTMTDEMTTEETTTTGTCPDSVIGDARRHVHSDYGLRIVSDSANPAVAVVGEDWRSALDTDAMSDADEAFVADTDFEGFVVLAIQYTKSSGGHELRVTDLGIDGETVRADVCVVARGATQDAPTANLFVRIPYSDAPPSQAQVSIQHPNETITVTSE